MMIVITIMIVKVIRTRVMCFQLEDKVCAPEWICKLTLCISGDKESNTLCGTYKHTNVQKIARKLSKH